MSTPILYIDTREHILLKMLNKNPKLLKIPYICKTLIHGDFKFTRTINDKNEEYIIERKRFDDLNSSINGEGSRYDVQKSAAITYRNKMKNSISVHLFYLFEMTHKSMNKSMNKSTKSINIQLPLPSIFDMINQVKEQVKEQVKKQPKQSLKLNTFDNKFIGSQTSLILKYGYHTLFTKNINQTILLLRTFYTKLSTIAKVKIDDVGAVSNIIIKKSKQSPKEVWFDSVLRNINGIGKISSKKIMSKFSTFNQLYNFIQNNDYLALSKITKINKSSARNVHNIIKSDL